MAQGKKSNGSQYESVGEGRVADKDKKTVYSANQIDQMKAVSDKARKKKK